MMQGSRLQKRKGERDREKKEEQGIFPRLYGASVCLRIFCYGFERADRISPTFRFSKRICPRHIKHNCLLNRTMKNSHISESVIDR